MKGITVVIMALLLSLPLIQAQNVQYQEKTPASAANVAITAADVAVILKEPAVIISSIAAGIFDAIDTVIALIFDIIDTIFVLCFGTILGGFFGNCLNALYNTFNLCLGGIGGYCVDLVEVVWSGILSCFAIINLVCGSALGGFCGGIVANFYNTVNLCLNVVNLVCGSALGGIWGGIVGTFADFVEVVWSAVLSVWDMFAPFCAGLVDGSYLSLIMATCAWIVQCGGIIPWYWYLRGCLKVIPFVCRYIPCISCVPTTLNMVKAVAKAVKAS